jgi:hypothetical protein
MPVDRATFDADQAAELQATTDYIAAVDAFLALPPVIDLQAEDDAVKAAGQAVADARSRVPSAPPPPPVP